MGLGVSPSVDLCFKKVLSDRRCLKDYFTFLPRSNKQCGCRKIGSGAVRIETVTRPPGVADYYQFKGHCVSSADPCKTNNGGCHSKRKCTSTNGKVTCGNCAAGYVNNGATKCKDIDPANCKVTATLHGPKVNALYPNLVAYSECIKGLHIFGHFDVNAFKMVGVKTAALKGSATPHGEGRRFSAKNGQIMINKFTVCKMWKGKGYNALQWRKMKNNDYRLKAVKVSNCG